MGDRQAGRDHPAQPAAIPDSGPRVGLAPAAAEFRQRKPFRVSRAARPLLLLSNGFGQRGMRWRTSNSGSQLRDQDPQGSETKQRGQSIVHVDREWPSDPENAGARDGDGSTECLPMMENQALGHNRRHEPGADRHEPGADHDQVRVPN